MKHLFCLVVILLVLASQASFGQPQPNDKVLAPGDPPLTLSLNDRLVDFFEWALASKLTKSQRTLFTTRLIEVWKKGDQPTLDSFVKMAKSSDDVSKQTKEERDAAQVRVQAVLLDAFEKDPSDRLGQLLLSVYKSSHPEATVASKQPQAPLNGPGTVSRVPAEMVGEWIARGGSGGSYVNPTTGQHSGANATVLSYKIFANGTYERTMLMQSSLYNCTTTIFGRQIGPIAVHGAIFTITPRTGTLESKNSCSPSLNERKPDIDPPATFNWRVQQGEFGLELCLTYPDGTKNTCFLKQ